MLRAALGLLACAVAALVYQNSFDNAFVFDDRETILLNGGLIRAWDWGSAVLHDPVRPVVALSFGLDRGFWGFSSFGFHVTNVILHIVCVGLFYGWCTRVVGEKGTRPGSDPVADWTAFFAAAIFAVHPVMSSAVLYASARSELLAAAGFIASLTYARRAIVRRNRTAGILAAVFGVLAVGSSPSAALLPLVVLAYDVWVLRDPGWTVRLARIYAPATLAIVTAALWHLTASTGTVVPPRGAIVNLLSEARVVWRYLGLLVFPRGQALVHDVQWVTSPLDVVSIALFAALVAAVAFAVRLRRTHPLVAFGVVWFAAVLAPTTSFVPLRDGMAEHRLYLASPGLLLALGSVSWQTIASRRSIRILLTGLVAVLAVATHRRTEVWASPMWLWEESVRRSPDAWQARLGYAELLREVGHCDRARPEYEAVLRLYPGHAGARAGVDVCRQP